MNHDVGKNVDELLRHRAKTLMGATPRYDANATGNGALPSPPNLPPPSTVQNVQNDNDAGGIDLTHIDDANDTIGASLTLMPHHIGQQHQQQQQFSYGGGEARYGGHPPAFVPREQVYNHVLAMPEVQQQHQQQQRFQPPNFQNYPQQQQQGAQHFNPLLLSGGGGGGVQRNHAQFPSQPPPGMMPHFQLYPVNHHQVRQQQQQQQQQRSALPPPHTNANGFNYTGMRPGSIPMINNAVTTGSREAMTQQILAQYTPQQIQAAIHQQRQYMQNVQQIAFQQRAAAAPATSQAPTTGFQGQQQQQPNPTTQAAMQAVINGMDILDNKGDEEMEPPMNYMNTVLLRHQRAALAWMSRREHGSAPPIGGILADDQGLGKTVTTIALVVTNPRAGIQRVPIPQSSKQPVKTQQSGGEVKDEQVDDAGPSNAGNSKICEEIVILDDDDDDDDGDGEEAAAVAAASVEASKILNEKLLAAPVEAPSKQQTTTAFPPPASTYQQRIQLVEEDADDIIDLVMDAPPPRPPLKSKSSSVAGPSSAPLEYGTLIVCPTTLLHQWAQEVRSKSNETRVYIYHGKNKGVSTKVLASFDVVITTYQTLVIEMPESKKPQARGGRTSVGGGGGGDLIDLVEEEEEEGPSVRGLKKRKREVGERGGPMFGVMWHRVVLDEAQMIKNSRTMAAHAAWALRARRRWCLSGTPIQNSIDDLYSYFRFLRYEPYCKYNTFKEMIKDPISGEDAAVGFRRLNAILQTILLRRTKQSKDKQGNLLVPLPERNVRLVQKEFSPEERKFYDQLDKEATAEIKKFESEGSAGSYYVNMLWMLLRMRQACNHPRLVRPIVHAGNNTQHQHKGEEAAARKLKPEERSKLAATLQSGMKECVTCCDVAEDPVVSVCNHVFCRQCVSAQLSMAAQGMEEAELAFHCPSCGSTLSSNQTFGAEALNVLNNDNQGRSGAAGAGGSGSGGFGQCERQDGSSTKVDALMEVLLELRKPAPSEAGSSENPPTSLLDAARGTIVTSVSRGHLKGELNRRASAVQSQGPKKVNKKGRGGGGGARESKPPLREKVIIFSQWTAMLDLIEIPLRKEDIEFRRLDGTMSASAREQAITDFTVDASVSVMLVSLKAASLGVNLVSANHVVLMDLWYNPSTEEQAIDRAHRIGQTKEVQVTRITIKDSIEDRILELQVKKKELVDSALGEEGKGVMGARMSMQEVMFLFNRR